MAELAVMFLGCLIGSAIGAAVMSWVLNRRPRRAEDPRRKVYKFPGTPETACRLRERPTGPRPEITGYQPKGPDGPQGPPPSGVGA